MRVRQHLPAAAVSPAELHGSLHGLRVVHLHSRRRLWQPDPPIELNEWLAESVLQRRQ